MDEKRYHELADAAFRKLIDGFDQCDVDEAEAEQSGDVITVVLQGGHKMVINTQKPAQQIWLAGGTAAWHFSYDDASGQWLDDKGRGELFATVAQLSKELGRVDVEF